MFEIGHRYQIKRTSTKDADIDKQEVRESEKRELSDIELVEGKRSKKGLLLRPQPSNDPNDPLA